MASENPFETPVPKGTRTVQSVLRVIVAIQCFGMAAAILHQGRSSAFVEFLAPAYYLNETDAEMLEKCAAVGLAVCGGLTLFRPISLLLAAITIWQGGEAISALMLNHGTIPELEPAEQAVRFMAPVGLLLIDFWPPKIKPTLAFCMASIGLLRLAAVATFAAHGMVAIFQYRHGGNFVELITLSSKNVLHYELDPTWARRSLAVIGAMDVALAFSLFTSRCRPVVFWMALWGFATAASRTLAYRADGYDMTLVRIANGGVPFVIFLFWMTAVQEQKPKVLPELEEDIERD